MIAGINMSGQVTGLYPQYNVNPINPIGKTEGTDIVEKSGKKGECQTCKNRKYVDGSNEGNVSFKTPGHISPESSGAVVMAHEPSSTVSGFSCPVACGPLPWSNLWTRD